ncbi:MAG: mechanosensitive ion channel, partial [Chromatiales bacterium]
MELLEISLLGNTVQRWLIALLVAVAAAVVLPIVKALVVRHLARIAERTETRWDDSAVALLRQTKGLFILILALFVGSLFLSLPERVQGITQAIVVIAVLVQGGIWLNAAILLWLENYRERKLKQDPATVTTMTAVGFVARLVLWSVILLLALDNLGVDVTALVAGLGVGGIAVALAVQNILSDLFASLSIVLDKPFAVGDFLIIDSFLGS